MQNDMTAAIGSASAPMVSICCTVARHRRRLPTTGKMRGSVSRTRHRLQRQRAGVLGTAYRGSADSFDWRHVNCTSYPNARKMWSNSVASATNLASPRSPITRSGTPRVDASVAASSSVAIAEVSRYEPP